MNATVEKIKKHTAAEYCLAYTADSNLSENTPALLAQWPRSFQNHFQAKVCKQFLGNSHCKTEDYNFLSVPYNKTLFQATKEPTVTNPLPDVLLTTGFNALYSSEFRNTSLNYSNFERLNLSFHWHYEKCEYVSPHKMLGMIAADSLVVIIDKNIFEGKKPREWYELLNPSLLKSIVFCGQDCSCFSVVAYHLVKNFGYDAIKRLTKNTLLATSSEEIMRSFDLGNSMGASVYVMPYSLARVVTDILHYQIIWPDDGALIVPIQLLVKKNSYQKHQSLVDFLTSPDFAQHLEHNGLLSTSSSSSQCNVQGALNWIGWDFLNDCDLEEINQTIKHSFNL